MKYVYINSTENRIVLTSQKMDDGCDANENLTRYAVPDDFDMTKDIEGERLDGFLTPDEFLARLNADYVALRVAEYPPIEDYLDGVVKGDQDQIDAYTAACQAVKDKYPKPE